MKSKKLLAFALSMAVAAGCTACGGGQASTDTSAAGSSDSTQAESSATGDNTVIVAMGSGFSTLDPGYVYEKYPQLIVNACYENLFKFYENNGTPQPCLADTYEFSEDGLTLTVKLKDGLTFASGNKITSADVAFSINRTKNLKGNPSFICDTIESIETPDDATVIFHLNQPDSAILSKLTYSSLAVLDSAVVKENGGTDAEDASSTDTAQSFLDNASAGSGMYILTSYTPDEEVVLEKNPNYWGEAPEVDSFSIKYIPDNDAKILAMQNGEVDFLSGIKNVSAESYAQMEQMDGYGAQVDEKSLQTYYVGYNLSSEIFGDQVVREAISSAIDKDAVVENIYGGLFDKADTFFSRDLPYCDVEQTVYGFDLDHANQILDEAGYVDTDGDGIREKNGVKLSAAFLYQTGTASDDNMVVYICDQASKIGIELTPQSAQMMDWYAMIQSGDYGLTIFKTQGGYYDPAMVITNINPSTSMDPILMQIGASQPELAALVDELDSATDEGRIQEIYNTILTTMADQCLTTPLIYTRQLAIYSDAVASYTFPTDASFTSVQNIHLN